MILSACSLINLSRTVLMEPAMFSVGFITDIDMHLLPNALAAAKQAAG